VGMDLFEEEAALLRENLSPRGLCIYVMADDLEDGAARMAVLRGVMSAGRGRRLR